MKLRLTAKCSADPTSMLANSAYGHNQEDDKTITVTSVCVGLFIPGNATLTYTRPNRKQSCWAACLEIEMSDNPARLEQTRQNCVQLFFKTVLGDERTRHEVIQFIAYQVIEQIPDAVPNAAQAIANAGNAKALRTIPALYRGVLPIVVVATIAAKAKE